MSNTEITVAMSCYNEGEWLRECWESVLAQTDDRWEAVLVMDGTDHEETRKVFQDLEHPRLRKHAVPENIGPYPVRNVACQLAATPLILWLDGDDQLRPNAVTVVLEAFRRHPEASYVYGDLERFGGESRTVHYRERFTPEALVSFHWPPGCAAFRKALWERLGGFAQELSRGMGDMDFFFGAMEVGAVGCHCGTSYYRHRVGHPSVSKSYLCQYEEKVETIVRRHPKFFEDARRRNAFLGKGYLRAAKANYAAGDRRQGNKLLRKARRFYSTFDREIWSTALRESLPRGVYLTIRGMFRFLRWIGEWIVKRG